MSCASRLYSPGGPDKGIVFFILEFDAQASQNLPAFCASVDFVGSTENTRASVAFLGSSENTSASVAFVGTPSARARAMPCFLCSAGAQMLIIRANATRPCAMTIFMENTSIYNTTREFPTPSASGTDTRDSTAYEQEEGCTCSRFRDSEVQPSRLKLERENSIGCIGDKLKDLKLRTQDPLWHAALDDALVALSDTQTFGIYRKVTLSADVSMAQGDERVHLRNLSSFTHVALCALARSIMIH
eukprot:gene8796-33666_t